MSAEIHAIERAQADEDLRTLISDTESARCQAMVNDYQFLAYLPELARVEAATLSRASESATR